MDALAREIRRHHVGLLRASTQLTRALVETNAILLRPLTDLDRLTLAARNIHAASAELRHVADAFAQAIADHHAAQSMETPDP